MLPAVPIFCPNYAQIMLAFPNYAFRKMSETSPKNVSRSCSETVLVLQCYSSIVFCFLCVMIRQRCLAMFAGSGMVSGQVIERHG